MNQSTITVNGKLYDAVTGAPVTDQAGNQVVRGSAGREKRPSHHVHRKTEKARTGDRRAPAAPVHTIQKRSNTPRPTTPAATVTRSPIVTKFAPHHSSLHKRPRTMNDIQPATTHPLVERAQARIQSNTHQPTAAIRPSAVLKKEAIEEALQKAPSQNPTKRAAHKKRAKSALSFASMALSLVLLAGYFTYINLPNLSVRVAAAQAGINANYPGYKPDGYRLAGVNYDKGSVSLEFAANAGPQSYTITQQQTSWDSTAVKENYVKTNWGDDAVPYSERGLTIYAHKGNAAWVNGGMLYTITGDAPLSAAQVRNIATSL